MRIIWRVKNVVGQDIMLDETMNKTIEYPFDLAIKKFHTKLELVNK